jgi:hypothetical protein
MLIPELFKWWYGQGWSVIVRRAKERIIKTERIFSLSAIIDNIFAPWKRIITYPGKSMGDRMRAMLDNLVSRMVGFLVRFIVLLLAGILLLGVCILGGLQIVLWPLVPIGALASIVRGVV